MRSEKPDNDEALSANEECQSTDAERLTSRAELQLLNAELAALNRELRETLARQRTTSNDLRSVLYSSDVATLFLDPDLNIRFFTPATGALFNVIPGDIGRPLADLSSLAVDGALPGDARTVLQTLVPVEREIEARSGVWYCRRVLPYRNQDQEVGGVVVTFVDVTERRRAAHTLEAAKHKAQLANAAKSRFLATASHDLRQPLQALSLMRGVLARKIKARKIDEALELVARLDETSSAMSGMLNTLLDINQLEARTVRAERVRFPINDLLHRLRAEFRYVADAKALSLRVVPCGLAIESDPRLLEQMIRNLLSNAMKYTKRGKVLLGCRRRGGMLSIEIWDTGVGIPGDKLQAIFEEYHQLDNAAHERSRGLGLGLAIVERLSGLLGHRVRVRSRPGIGSVFAIDVKLQPSGAAAPLRHQPPGADAPAAEGRRQTGAILVIEDDPALRGLLEHLLTDEGHRVATAADGAAALNLLAHGAFLPDLVLADRNLPGGMNGLQVAAAMRERLHRHVPVVMLTGDTSTGCLRDIARQDCVQLNKPVEAKALMEAIARLLAQPPAPLPRPVPRTQLRPPTIFIVDDDRLVREGIRDLLQDDGRTVEIYSSCEAFLEAYRPDCEACLLIDAYLPGMSGLELLQRLHAAGHRLPAIMITGNSDVPTAVLAMKAGASDFIEKPIGHTELLASIERALEQSRDAGKLAAAHETAAGAVARLTPRQRQVMERVLAGHPSKNIAADLGISQRTVENHRASIMHRTGSRSLPALARLALAAASNEPAQTDH